MHGPDSSFGARNAKRQIGPVHKRDGPSALSCCFLPPSCYNSFVCLPLRQPAVVRLPYEPT